jgi:cytochrome c biogenesis protein CcmG/thiol:disulfide interchange protein DsbE
VSVETEAPRRLRFLVLVPLAAFVALAAIFMLQLFSGRDVSEVPSALIGQSAPETKLPPLDGMQVPGIDSASFKGKVTVLNVWASWCAPCREEHPYLLALSRDTRFDLAGMNYKDEPAKAKKFLDEVGNPFAAIGVDAAGRTGIDWGVYGVPETFVIGKDGRIAYKHVGPLSKDSLEERLMPEIEKALGGG